MSAISLTCYPPTWHSYRPPVTGEESALTTPPHKCGNGRTGEGERVRLKFRTWLRSHGARSVAAAAATTIESSLKRLKSSARIVISTQTNTHYWIALDVKSSWEISTVILVLVITKRETKERARNGEKETHFVVGWFARAGSFGTRASHKLCFLIFSILPIKATRIYSIKKTTSWSGLNSVLPLFLATDRRTPKRAPCATNYRTILVRQASKNPITVQRYVTWSGARRRGRQQQRQQLNVRVSGKAAERENLTPNTSQCPSTCARAWKCAACRLIL